MPLRLKAQLAYPVTLANEPSRELETLLDAVAYLHERQRATPTPKADEIIDLLFTAATTQSTVDLQHATDALASLIAELIAEVRTGN